MAAHDNPIMVITRYVLIEDIQIDDHGYQRISVDGELYEWRFMVNAERLGDMLTLAMEAMYQNKNED